MNVFCIEMDCVTSVNIYFIILLGIAILATVGVVVLRIKEKHRWKDTDSRKFEDSIENEDDIDQV